MIFVAEKSKAKNCADDEFDCDDATCISAALKCNGLYNCRFRWDEDNCQVSTYYVIQFRHDVCVYWAKLLWENNYERNDIKKIYRQPWAFTQAKIRK